MIIIKIQGGLGNQMFQYALGRNIAITNKTTVKFDLSWFEQYKTRTYKLHHFNIVGDFATNKESKRLKKYGRKAGRLAFLHNYFIADDSIYIKQKQFEFNPKILKNKGPAYLDGHWQSKKYFKNVEDVIREEFTLKNEPSNTYKNNEQKIKERNSVSLHIRRGDYITMKKAADAIGVCPLDYYYKAVKKIAKKIEKPTFFIFSDDIEWVKKNLKIKYPMIFVSNNKLEDYEELILMSKCKHNIIANSSFSWWGAWLNNNPNKMVIAPKRWFKDPSKNTGDLIPENWIKL